MIAGVGQGKIYALQIYYSQLLLGIHFSQNKNKPLPFMQSDLGVYNSQMKLLFLLGRRPNLGIRLI